GDLQDYRALVLRADRDETKSKTKQDKSKKPTVAKETAHIAGLDKAESRRRTSEARKAALPFKEQAEQAERRMTQASKRIEDIDSDLATPGLSSDSLQDLMRGRAALADDLEQAETEWIEATEAYEQIVTGTG
ncbi:MAG: ABC transporter ATP-binding protein, partial [Pseudomonadota bacterium]